jgi:molecular chaperone GrpE (heat shock protein)
MSKLQTRRTESSYDSLFSLIYLAIFVLSTALLVVSIKQIQQGLNGPLQFFITAMSALGIVGSAAAILFTMGKAGSAPSADKPAAAQTPAQSAAPAESQSGSPQANEYFEKLIAALEKEKGDLEDDKVKLRRQIKSLTKNVLDWEERSIEVFRICERILSSEEELSHDLRAVMENFKDAYARLVEPMGIRLIEPKPGDRFDDKIHRIAGELNDASQPAWTVVKCESWGYIVNNTVQEPARVIITNR